MENHDIGGTPRKRERGVHNGRTQRAWKESVQLEGGLYDYSHVQESGGCAEFGINSKILRRRSS